MYGIYAPAGVPAPILNALNHEIGLIINSPDMAKRIAADGAEAAPPASQEAFRRRFAEEIAMWEKFIRTSGVKVDMR
jgi:tripartite-type tricarboxylate transporter receptor subunit TctC